MDIAIARDDIYFSQNSIYDAKSIIKGKRKGIDEENRYYRWTER